MMKTGTAIPDPTANPVFEARFFFFPYSTGYTAHVPAAAFRHQSIPNKPVNLVL
jgi:hypothetical protein